MNLIERSKKNFISMLIFAFFCLLFFIPRYFAHLQYDVLEDEFLSLIFNSSNTIKNLLLTPDLAHPPLWYILMDYPTQIIGLDHGIFYYRLIQVLILFCLFIFTLFYFYKKLPKKFLFIFFSLFLSNIYLVHLTSQHRMYSVILGISTFYSFYWYYLIKNEKNNSSKHFFLLGLIAAIGFFINYSIIWVIPIWPLAYVFYKRNRIDFKNFVIFSCTFLVLISWFLPTFIRNTLLTGSVKTEYHMDFNLSNFIKLFDNYFGIIPTNDPLINNFVTTPYFLLLFYLFFFSKKVDKHLYRKKIIIFLIPSFLLVLIFGIFNDFKILSPRVSVPLVIVFYVLIADSFSKFKYSQAIVYSLIILQLTQFTIYFASNPQKLLKYNSFNYKYHPIHYFADFDFLPNSCLTTIPDWNEFSANYFFGNKVKVVNDEQFFEEIASGQKKCKNMYILDQFSLEREVVDYKIQTIKGYGLDFYNLLITENQILYILH